MQRMIRALTLALLVGPSLPAVARAEEGVRFLPFMGPRLEAARYSPANEEFAWVGWIGATADLVQAGRFTAYFTPEVETVLGHRIRSFEAVQANYSLELGGRYQAGRGRAQVFFHHVSRHVQDRQKVQVVDWNFLGARYDSPWPKAWKRRGGFDASLAAATLSSGVKYNWEARAAADIDLIHREGRAGYLQGSLRFVSATPSVGFTRGSFADFRLEGGFRKWQADSQFALFVAWEHRNDAPIQRELVIDRALFGFRIRGQKHEAPAYPAIP